MVSRKPRLPQSGNGTQLQGEHSCLAFAKHEPRRARLNPIKEFDVALLARFDEVHRVRDILPGSAEGVVASANAAVATWVGAVVVAVAIPRG